MKISVLVNLITATSIVRCVTFNELSKAELRPRMNTRNRAKNQAKAQAKLQAQLQAQGIQGQNCPTDGFSPVALPCTCNFAGACHPGTNVVSQAAKADLHNLNGIAPDGLHVLALGPARSVGAICERGIVAVLYDCNALSAVYAATVINGAHLSMPVNPTITREKSRWESTTDSNLLKNPQLWVTKKDYISKNVYCYEDTTGKLLNWNGLGLCSNQSPKVPIHKGHLIAASYGKTYGTQSAIDATFVYTNAVPQVGRFNSVEWRIAEADYVIERAKQCQNDAQKRDKTINGKTYVVVGVIPSSFLGQPRFFGSAGFGNFQGAAKGRAGNYRISFPEIMWTAGCCIHTDGRFGGSFGFWRRNDLTKTAVESAQSPSDMFKAIQQKISTTWQGIILNPPNVFPSAPACN